jgi:succinate dehydrogenase / fumarate reductase cytochrome b subunit
MAASITHRATGIALYAGAILLAAAFVALALGREAYGVVRFVTTSPPGLLILFGFAWSLLFHALSGLRHLYWDSGRGLDPRMARATSWAIYAASLIGALVLFAPALIGSA